MLYTEKVVSGYNKVMIVNNIDIQISKGEMVSIIGRNGVGKSTLMKTLIGLNKVEKGKIFLGDRDISKTKAHTRAQMGIGYVPQGHGIFPLLSVEENLIMGKNINSKKMADNFEIVYSYFPRLMERKRQKAGTMSGGEQAMLSIGRVLIGAPEIILLDEPSEGVQPNVVSQMGEILLKISKELMITVLMVEQHMGLIQQISDRGYVMDKGSIIASLSKEQINNSEEIRRYLTI